MIKRKVVKKEFNSIIKTRVTSFSLPPYIINSSSSHLILTLQGENHQIRVNRSNLRKTTVVPGFAVTAAVINSRTQVLARVSVAVSGRNRW
ncbi:hypothetical protein HanRHA438_Chr07g0312871 [Helianthus annuus]|uniref:Uncharacterized protein n=1 Tax=Helianthus annuus TaxID=4232 RepID=A0A251UBH8_HELAN|nr:hypothetical protein HanXRQr2_Chr07g0303001 [Helianthus annuus]KAJ0550757.1 hypothetical protein HanHA300_Chr07g0249501 [Helianthus annuus]KAJ0557591.1 hypothetical protein HanIR_Chr07g0326841 [Helianthus annuus]KAJ0563724.1 hypothetical protein HanHA89_Chr07g0266321 [Helianthus annuus]KAJ0729056.1 hypothetical protein HanLR1_Chr07g0248621 [Helianthus annuus]